MGIYMTENEKLDLILLKFDKLDGDVQGLKSELQEVKSDVQGLKGEMKTVQKDLAALKRQVAKSTAELKDMDDLILNEVERVHKILDNHKSDKTVHLA